MIIQPMDRKRAQEIVCWRYQPPYSLYNIEASEEALTELLDGSYYQVVDVQGQLMGYYCFGQTARVPAGHSHGVYREIRALDIGLGMRPDLTGKGHGTLFFKKGLEFAIKTFNPREFRLTVAVFNQRAIRVYERLGFKIKDRFTRQDKTGTLEFITMTMTPGPQLLDSFKGE